MHPDWRLAGILAFLAVWTWLFAQLGRTLLALPSIEAHAQLVRTIALP